MHSTSSRRGKAVLATVGAGALVFGATCASSGCAANVAGAFVGAVTSFVGSVAGQMIMRKDVNITDALVAAGTGAAAGFFAPGSNPMILNAVANTVQYVLTSDHPTVLRAAAALGIGALAGAAGGPFSRLGEYAPSIFLSGDKYAFMVSANEVSSAIGAFGAMNFARNFAAGTLTGLPLLN